MMQFRRWQLAIPPFLVAAVLVSFDFDGYGRLHGSSTIWVAVGVLLAIALSLWFGKPIRDLIVIHRRNRRWGRLSSSELQDEGLGLHQCLEGSQRALDSIREARMAVDQARRGADCRGEKSLKKAEERLGWLDDWIGELIEDMESEEQDFLER
jgi:hypothetical protein